jgi:putative transposase
MSPVWRAHWQEFTPFLAFPPEVRRVIYTTNLIWVFGSWDQRERCFSGWRSPWPALTLNVIDALRAVLDSNRRAGRVNADPGCLA